MKHPEDSIEGMIERLEAKKEKYWQEALTTKDKILYRVLKAKIDHTEGEIQNCFNVKKIIEARIGELERCDWCHRKLDIHSEQDLKLCGDINHILIKELKRLLFDPKKTEGDVK